MISILRPHTNILDIMDYIPGEDTLPGFDKPAKLSSNESPLGPSPRAIQAFKDASEELARYPDGSCNRLRQVLADHHDIHPEQIVCSNGSEQLIDMLARAYAGPGAEVIFTEHAFICYRIATQAAGGTAVVVAEHNLTTDVDEILDNVTDRTRIVFLANPNNPTGTYIAKEESQRLRDSLPKHVLLVIDAAYCEYVDQADYSAGNELVNHSDCNTVVLRTFSKIYGLAALRIGWAYCPSEVASVLNRIRGAFCVSKPAQEAAVEALQDRQHTATAKTHNDRWLSWLITELDQIRLTATPSVGNFILIHFDDADQSLAADLTLRQQGIILRPVAGYGLPQYLRASVGLEHENRKMIKVLKSFVTKCKENINVG